MLGLISDTHGLVRESALASLAGVSHIVHAGDVGRAEVLDRLRAVAPVTAVRGNVDDALAPMLPEVATVELEGALVVVAHVRDTAVAAAARRRRHDLPCLVVFGHSHRATVETIGDLLLVNPGSAGPRRFGLPITLALARVEDGRPRAEIVTLAA